MTSMPPGWYDDGRGALRWWDGTQWTEHVATPDPEPAPGDAPADPQADEPLPPELAEAEPAYAPAPGEPGAQPSGYPGGFQGGDAPAGAFVAATEPTKSKTWIVWVVLGVVLLGIVIAAAVLLPLLFLSLTAGGGSTGPQGADEEAAVAAVELYDEAWQEADCDKLTESTTEAFREAQGLTDCATFEEAAQSFTGAVEDYQVTVTSIESGGDMITIQTTETFDALFDENDNPVDEPIPSTSEYTYVVVPDGGGWAIDDLS